MGTCEQQCLAYDLVNLSLVQEHRLHSLQSALLPVLQQLLEPSSDKIPCVACTVSHKAVVEYNIIQISSLP